LDASLAAASMLLGYSGGTKEPSEKEWAALMSALYVWADGTAADEPPDR
jgi:hypothetical protein